MKKNRSKIVSIILAIIIVVFLIFLSFLPINYVGNIQTTAIGGREIGFAGQTELNFVTDRKVSGLLIIINKNFYIEKEKDKKLTVVVSFRDRNNQLQNESQETPLSNLKNKKYNWIKFSAEPQSGAAVYVKFINNSRFETNNQLSIGIADSNPDPQIDNGPGVVFQTRIINLIKETVSDIRHHYNHVLLTFFPAIITFFILIFFILIPKKNGRR